MSGETTGDLIPQFETFEKKVGMVVRRGARGNVGQTEFSIIPNPNGATNLEVAFSRTDSKTTSEPIIIRGATDEDVEEIADTIVGYLKKGKTSKEIIEHLEKTE